MFQLSDTMMKGLAFREDFITPGMKGVVVSELVLPFVDGRLQNQSKFGFFMLDDQMRDYPAQERRGQLAADVPHQNVSLFGIADAVAVDAQRASVRRLNKADDGGVDHAYAGKDLVADVDAVGLRPLSNADVALAVEQARNVTIIKQDDLSPSFGWDDGEFGGSPMPGPKGCGRVTPSQAGGRDWPLGVCNEQGPSAKAKACSELHGNMQRSAEMTDPASCDQSSN